MDSRAGFPTYKSGRAEDSYSPHGMTSSIASKDSAPVNRLLMVFTLRRNTCKICSTKSDLYLLLVVFAYQQLSFHQKCLIAKIGKRWGRSRGKRIALGEASSAHSSHTLVTRIYDRNPIEQVDLRFRVTDGSMLKTSDMNTSLSRRAKHASGTLSSRNPHVLVRYAT